MEDLEGIQTQKHGGKPGHFEGRADAMLENLALFFNGESIVFWRC